MFGKSATRNSVKPLARNEGLSATVSGDETLVYDRERYVIHRLNTELATIWQLADGTRDIATMAQEAGVNSRDATESLHTLTAMGLMQGDLIRSPRFTRRHLFGSAAGAAAAGTFIAPVAASSCVSGKVENGCNPNQIGNQLFWRECINGAWGPCCKGATVVCV